MKKITILAVLLVGSIAAMAVCYDKAVPDPQDQNVVYSESCTNQANCGGTCGGTSREQVQNCGTDSNPTGNFCSMGSKDVKLNIFIGSCGKNAAGVCDCLNKRNTEGGTVTITTCECVACPAE